MLEINQYIIRSRKKSNDKLKKVGCIYYEVRMDFLKPGEITSSNYMQAKGYFTCPYCGDIEIVHECAEFFASSYLSFNIF